MRSFFIRSALFLVPVFMLLGIMEYALRSIPNNYAYIDDQLLNHGSNVEVLILGNSHPYNGIDPTGIGRPAFNAAHPSQDHRLDRLLLARYIDHLPQLKAIVLSTSYVSIGKQMDQDKESWRLKNYVIHMGLFTESVAPKDHLELLNGKLSDRIGSIRDHWYNGKDNLTVQVLGGNPGKPRTGVDLKEDGARAAERHHAKTYSAFERNRLELEALLQLAQQRGIRVLLFAPPGHEAYRKHLHPAQLVLSKQIPRDLAQRYNDVVFVDLLADPRFEDPDFSDGDHLNGAGNRKLTAILVAELDSLMGS